jgi:hypothetical protein
MFPLSPTPLNPQPSEGVVWNSYSSVIGTFSLLELVSALSNVNSVRLGTASFSAAPEYTSPASSYSGQGGGASAESERRAGSVTRLPIGPPLPSHSAMLGGAQTLAPRPH